MNKKLGWWGVLFVGCATFIAGASETESPPAATAANPTASATPSLPTNEVMRHFRSLEDPQLSPDGSHALLQVSESAADGGKSHIWLLDTGGGAPRQLT